VCLITQQKETSSTLPKANNTKTVLKTCILSLLENEKLEKELCEISRDSAKFHTTKRGKFHSAEG
jgi:hypothetical protein